MQINHLLAVVPVRDFALASEWYERLFGAEPTNVPMPGILAEWRVTNTGWAQVFVDEAPSGHGSFNLAVESIEEYKADLERVGITAAETVNANKGVQTAEVIDPFGNRINLIGSFREKY